MSRHLSQAAADVASVTQPITEKFVVVCFTRKTNSFKLPNDRGSNR